MSDNAKASGRAIPEGVKKADYEEPEMSACTLGDLDILCASGNESFEPEYGEW